MSFDGFLAGQFARPSGMAGWLVAQWMNRQNRPMYAAAVRLLSLEGADHVLDVGCGNGAVLKMMAAAVDARFAGVDVSPLMVRAAARLNRPQIRRQSMVISLGSVANLPFADAAFSKVLTINTVYFWDDLAAGLAEIRRVLRPGGLFVNVLYSNATLAEHSHTRIGYRHYPPDHLVEQSTEAGLRPKLTPILNNAAYALVCQAV